VKPNTPATASRFARDSFGRARREETAEGMYREQPMSDGRFEAEPADWQRQPLLSGYATG
jgi:hypothetical protein